MSFWRIAYSDGRYWMIAPWDEKTFSIGLNSVEPNDHWREKYTNRQAWKDDTRALLDRCGINTLGAFGSQGDRIDGMPWCWHLNLLGGYTSKKGMAPKSPSQLKLVSEPGFKQFCLEQCEAEARPYEADETLQLYFFDNELNFNSSLANFSSLVNTYFEVCRNAVRAFDSEHLLAGCRLHRPTFGKDVVFRKTGQYCDLLAINYYGVDKPSLSQTARWKTLSGKPYLVSEMYAMANRGVLDDMPCDNSHGAGKVVERQADRANWYNAFMDTAYRDPNWIGTHWFRYQDDPTSGGSNKGIVGNKFSVYDRLTTQMAITHERSPAVA